MLPAAYMMVPVAWLLATDLVYQSTHKVLSPDNSQLAVKSLIVKLFFVEGDEVIYRSLGIDVDELHNYQLDRYDTNTGEIGKSFKCGKNERKVKRPLTIFLIEDRSLFRIFSQIN